MVSDLIVVETGQLRGAALAMQRASESFQEIALSLPAVIPGLPGGLGGGETDVAGVIARLRSLAGELLDESSLLRARADQVDTAEQQVWQLPGGQTFCGCTLPTGEVVAVAIPVATPVATPVDASAAPTTMSTMGGSADSLFPSFTITNDGPGLSTPYDAEIAAGVDKMGAGILGAAIGGATPLGPTGFPNLVEASDPGLQTLPGDGMAIYTGPMGTPVKDYMSSHPGETGHY